MITIVRLLLLSLGLYGSAAATEWQPWLGNPYELAWRAAVVECNYAYLSSGACLEKYPSHDLFLKFSLCGALPEFALEVEAVGASTRRQKGNLDHLKVTGRYLWQDDIAGDPLSVVTGLSLIYALPPSVSDVSAYHHGWAETECFLSLGRELSSGATWLSRWWALWGLGMAERGSPWLRCNLAYQKRLWTEHELGVFVHSWWGLGSHRLRLNHFQGYASVRHQSVDLGLSYVCLLSCLGSVSIEYAYRVYGRNLPDRVHSVLLQLFYPFGL